MEVWKRFLRDIIQDTVHGPGAYFFISLRVTFTQPYIWKGPRSSQNLDPLHMPFLCFALISERGGENAGISATCFPTFRVKCSGHFLLLKNKVNPGNYGVLVNWLY